MVWNFRAVRHLTPDIPTLEPILLLDLQILAFQFLDSESSDRALTDGQLQLFLELWIVANFPESRIEPFQKAMLDRKEEAKWFAFLKSNLQMRSREFPIYCKGERHPVRLYDGRHCLNAIFE